MAIKRSSNNDIIKLTKRLMRNERFIRSIAASSTEKKKNRLGSLVRRFAARTKDKRATDKYVASREKGLSLNQLLAGVERKIRENSIRDKVTIVNLRLTNRKTKILSRTLTYDRHTTGRLQVRPHKHIVTIIPSKNDPANVKFSKAKRIKVQCDCEDFMYRHEYALSKRWGAADIVFGNGEYPYDKNPGLAATICKHLYQLLRYIKMQDI